MASMMTLQRRVRLIDVKAARSYRCRNGATERRAHRCGEAIGLFRARNLHENG